MALFNNFPYTDLNDINLDYTLQKLESLYTRGEQLYSTLTTWQQATDAELEQWKAATESSLALWKTQTENSIDSKIQLLTAAINTAFTELRTQLEAHIAEIETTAVNAASAASDSATAAAGAASAASINNEQSKEWAIGETLEGDPVPSTNPAYENNAKYYADLLGQETAQIDQNTTDITDLKSAITETQIINFDDYQTVNYGISTDNNWNRDSSYRACSVPVKDNVKKITVTANENLAALFALVQLIDYADGRPVTYATGEYRRTLNAGETVTIDVPDDCHYLWVLKSNDGGTTIKTPSLTSFYLVKKTPIVDETLSISGDAADAEVTGNNIKEIHEKIGITESLEVTRVRSGYINYSNGSATGTSGSTSYTYPVNISAFESLIYSRLYSTSSSSNAGMAFYDEGGTYISGQRCAINQSSTRYVLTEIAVPEDAVTARFTQHDSLTGFVLIGKLKGYAETSLQGQIDTLDDDLHKLVPPPLKRVSILGDSISTFASPYEIFEGSKWAPEGCVTNYPGNRLRYPDGDITEVNQLWWKIVIDYFGWSLGINDSWAGSRISWDGTEDTDSTHTRPSHVGENIYFGSTTRIGHLGENGTPDIIFIFGGTNDINHLATSQIGTLPTDDPSGYDQTALDALAVDTFKDAVTAMVLRMQYAYPSAKIIALMPYYVTNNYSGKTPYSVKLFDDALVECYDYLGVEHIDLRKTMTIYGRNNVLADGLHPNAAYMRVIADAVIKHILDTVS